MNNNGFEIERKYLIRYPNLTILGRNAEATDIVQTYLLCPEPGSSERVRKRGADIVFLRKIVPGAADDSYGVEVARLAGLPDKVVSRARELLKDLESGAPVRTVTVAAPDQFSITSMENDALRRKLESIAVETLTPIEAMNALYELKQML